MLLVDVNTTAKETPEPTSFLLPAKDIRVDEEGRPRFPPSKNVDSSHIADCRKVLIPPHRLSPLRTAWPKIYPPLVEHLKLQVRMNLKGKAVELRTSKYTNDDGALQKAQDFVQAFCLGFDVDDAIALLRLDDLYIEVGLPTRRSYSYLTFVKTFEIKDVKTLHGEHLGRAIGRICGKDGLSLCFATTTYLPLTISRQNQVCYRERHKD